MSDCNDTYKDVTLDGKMSCRAKTYIDVNIAGKWIRVCATPADPTASHFVLWTILTLPHANRMVVGVEGAPHRVVVLYMPAIRRLWVRANKLFGMKKGSGVWV